MKSFTARLISENTFEILAHWWRRLVTTMQQEEEIVHIILNACFRLRKSMCEIFTRNYRIEVIARKEITKKEYLRNVMPQDMQNNQDRNS